MNSLGGVLDIDEGSYSVRMGLGSGLFFIILIEEVGLSRTAGSLISTHVLIIIIYSINDIKNA
jgi:hypothetical protein